MSQHGRNGGAADAAPPFGVRGEYAPGLACSRQTIVTAWSALLSASSTAAGPSWRPRPPVVARVVPLSQAPWCGASQLPRRVTPVGTRRLLRKRHCPAGRKTSPPVFPCASRDAWIAAVSSALPSPMTPGGLSAAQTRRPNVSSNRQKMGSSLTTPAFPARSRRAYRPARGPSPRPARSGAYWRRWSRKRRPPPDTSRARCRRCRLCPRPC